MSGESTGRTFARVFDAETFQVLGALLASSLLVAGAIMLLLTVSRAVPPGMWKRLLVLFLSLAIFGAIAGYAGGISRSPAVGDIIPAVIGLAGGLAVYLFGLDVTRGSTSSIALVAFTVALFMGYSFGSSVRTSNDRNAELRQACIRLFFDPSIYVSEEIESRVFGNEDQRYRDCLRYMY